jgi:hypothetical protein
MIRGLAAPAVGALLGTLFVWTKPRYRWTGATIGFIVIVALMYVGEHRV